MRAAKLVQVDRDLAEEHYAEHVEKPFFGELVEFITSVADARARRSRARARSRSYGRRWERRTRSKPLPGTVRGDLALAMPDNLVHGSDSPESAEREIGLWFNAAELV